MQLHQPLDHILDSEPKVRIVRFLCRKGGEWGGRRLAVALAMNPVTAHRALRELHQATLLDFRKIGNQFLYSLRDEHVLVREMVRPLFEREASVREHLTHTLKQEFRSLRISVVAAALYGSVARGQERPTSDIDLLILVRSAQAKAQVRAELGPVEATVLRRFGNPLAVHVNTVREARQKARRGLPLFRNILRDHHLLWGLRLEEVLNGR